jgi:hypothetical protein
MAALTSIRDQEAEFELNGLFHFETAVGGLAPRMLPQRQNLDRTPVQDHLLGLLSVSYPLFPHHIGKAVIGGSVPLAGSLAPCRFSEQAQRQGDHPDRKKDRRQNRRDRPVDKVYQIAT